MKLRALREGGAPRLTTMQVLIIDDDSHVGEHLERTLSPQGIHLHRADTLCEGIRWLLAHGADAILVDAHLPGLSGPADLRLLGEVAGASPVVVVLGEWAPADLVAAYRRQSSVMLTKPFDAMALARMLARLAAPAGTIRTKRGEVR